MPTVYRQQYVRVIPEGAERVTTTVRRGRREIEVEAVRFKDNGRWVVAPVVATGNHAGTHCRVKSPRWYGWVGGKSVPLSTNKAAAEAMLADLIRKRERGRAGFSDPFEGHGKRPLAGHLGDYLAELASRGDNARYVALVRSRLSALLEGCAFRFTADLSASRAADWLAGLRKPGPSVELPPKQELFSRSEAAELLGMTPTAFRDAVKRHRLPAQGKGPARRYPRVALEGVLARLGKGASPQTTNYYVSHLKSFCRWLVKDRRMADNPMDRIEANDTAADRRHDRRELADDELRRVLATTRASGRRYRGLDGEDRFHLYATACGTGFRALSLASLTPESFDLDATPPVVVLAARSNKSRKRKVQPIPADLAELLRGYLKDKPAGVPVWAGTGTWARYGKGAEMLRLDLDDAGIAYVVEGPDGPLYADFHSLRHTYLTLGARAGIDLRTLQELAGHSTPVLTARYAHVGLRDQAGAVEKLPSILPEAGFAYRPLTGASDANGGKRASTDKTDPESPDSGPRRKSRNAKQLGRPDATRRDLKEEAPPGFEPGMADLQSSALACPIPGPGENFCQLSRCGQGLAARLSFAAYAGFRLARKRKEYILVNSQTTSRDGLTAIGPWPHRRLGAFVDGRERRAGNANHPPPPPAPC